MKSLLLICFVCVSSWSWGQLSSMPLFETDTSKVVQLGHHGFMYGAYQVRLGLNYQEASGLELGIQRSRVASFGGANVYLSNSFLMHPNEIITFKTRRDRKVCNILQEKIDYFVRK